MSVDLPAIYVQVAEKADRTDNPVVEFLRVDVYESGRYEVTVKKQGWDDYVESYDVGTSDVYVTNAPILREVATITVPIFSLGRITFITLSATDPLPAAVTSYSWQGHYNKRDIAVLNQR